MHFINGQASTFSFLKKGPNLRFSLQSKYEDLVTLGDLKIPLRHLGNQGTLGFLFWATSIHVTTASYLNSNRLT